MRTVQDAWISTALTIVNCLTCGHAHLCWAAARPACSCPGRYAVRFRCWETRASRSELERPTAHQKTGRSGRSASSEPVGSLQRPRHSRRSRSRWLRGQLGGSPRAVPAKQEARGAQVYSGLRPTTPHWRERKFEIAQGCHPARSPAATLTR